LDLSAAFDTIDHSILLHRLSTWFGFNGKVIAWLKSYRNHTGSWSLSTQLLLLSILSVSVPRKDQSSVLFYLFYSRLLLLVFLYLTHLWVIIRLLVQSTCEISSKMSYLQVTVDLVSLWMSSNPLSLNQTKTEFLLIGLPAQLPKFSDSSLLVPSNAIITPTSSARNLGVIFYSTFSMSDHISSISKLCFLSIRDLRRLHYCTHCRHISCTQNLTTATHLF